MSDTDDTSLADAERILLDVNALAIGLVDDHPGHEYVRPPIDAGCDGAYDLQVFDYHPLRAQYLMTTDFEVERVPARNSVQAFLRQPITLVSATRETLLNAYEISAAKNHDVYDCFLLALAQAHDTDALLTTDTDFADLCRDESIAYVNPVPTAILERFGSLSG